MITAEISKNLGQMFFDGAYPKTEYGTHEQRRNAAGVPLWSVSVLLRQPDSKKTESLTITIPAQQDPAEMIEPFTPIAFDGLRVMTGENNGRVWVSFAADKCVKPTKQ